MWFQVNNVDILFSFNQGIHVNVNGPDNYYLVEVLEYKKNHLSPVALESYHVNTLGLVGIPNFFTLPIEFHMDFEVNIYKVELNHGLKKIFTHRFNDAGKLVKFIVETEDKDEAHLWYESIAEYCKLHLCDKVIQSRFPSVNKFSNPKYFAKNIEPYKTYRIGRFPKVSNDWRTLDLRKEGLIWFGNWKTFWSYQHPRDWKNLSSKEIVNDILGL